MYEVIKIGAACYAVVENGREITRFAFRADAVVWARSAQALADALRAERGEQDEQGA